jgi:hypothetical protein
MPDKLSAWRGCIDARVAPRNGFLRQEYARLRPWESARLLPGASCGASEGELRRLAGDWRVSQINNLLIL